MCTGTSPRPPRSIVLDGVLIPDRKRCVSSVDGNLAAAVLSPGGVYISGNQRNKEFDINHFLHVFLARAHFGVLKATAQQHGIHLVGELATCSGCSQAKGIRAATPRYTTVQARAPMCVCFLPIHSGHQVRWTYQPGSHRRKVTQHF